MNVYRTIENIVAQQSTSDIIEIACSEVLTLSGIDSAAFYVWDKDMSSLVKQNWYRIGNVHLAEQISVPPGNESENAIFQAIQSGQVELVRYDKRRGAIPVFSPKAVWEIVVPIILKDNLYGVFTAASEKSIPLKRMVALLQHIGRIVSIRLEEKLYKSSKNTLKLSEDILSITAMPLDKIPDFSEFYRNCFAILQKVEPSLTYGCIWLCSAEYDGYEKLVLRAVLENSLIPTRDYQKISISDVAIGAAISEKEPKYWKSVRQIQQFHNSNIQKRYGHCQLLAIPFQSIGKIPIGLITLYLPDICPNVKERIPEFQTYVNHVGSAIAQAILAEKRKSVETIFRVTTEFIATNPNFVQLDNESDFFTDLSSKLRDAINVGGLAVFFRETEVSERLILFATSGVEIPGDWVGIPYFDVWEKNLMCQTW